MMRIPISIKRIQFNLSLTFKGAKEIVPYLPEVGISHIYASSIFRGRLREGESPTGQDIVADTYIVLPEGIFTLWKDVIGAQAIKGEKGLACKRSTKIFSVALFISEEEI